MAKAKGTPTKQTGKTAPFVFKGYVAFNLSMEHKEQFDAWLTSITAELLLSHMQALSEVFKISVAYDHINECATASLSCIDATRAEFGYVMTARAGDIFEALALVIYKSEVLLQGTWVSRLDDNKVKKWG